MNAPSTSLSFQIDQFKANLRQFENDNMLGLMADITQCFLEVMEELLALDEYSRDFQLVPWRLEMKLIDLRVQICYRNIKDSKRISLLDLDRKIQEVNKKIVLTPSMQLKETRHYLANHINILRNFEKIKIPREIPLVALRQHFLPGNVWEAAEVGAVDELKETINALWVWQRKSYVNQLNDNGSSPLQIAAYRNQVAFLELLLSHGADLLSKDKHTYQALHWTAKGGALDAAIWLLKLNANVNEKAEYGRVPLHLAAYNNHPELVALLLNRGADPNVRAEGDGGVTPLHEAVTKNNSLVVELLIRADTIDVDLRDAFNHTPFYYAVLSGHVELAESIISHLSWRKCLTDRSDPNHPLQLLKILPTTLPEDVRHYLQQVLKEASDSTVQVEEEPSRQNSPRNPYAKKWCANLLAVLDGSFAEQEKMVEEAVQNYRGSEVGMCLISRNAFRIF